MTFEEFSASGASLRNSWIEEPGLSIYVRKPTGFMHNADFELASMEAEDPGRGSLRAFLERYEPSYTFYVENLLNERLASFFERRGYRVVSKVAGTLDVCMISPGCWHLNDR